MSAGKEVAKRRHRTACHEVDNRFEFVISRCEVVSNLKNGLKGWEPLSTALAFAAPQTAQSCHFKFTYSISKSRFATLPAILPPSRNLVSTMDILIFHVTMC